MTLTPGIDDLPLHTLGPVPCSIQILAVPTITMESASRRSDAHASDSRGWPTLDHDLLVAFLRPRKTMEGC